MSKKIKTQLIIFRKNHLLNQDLLISVFTEDRGKITVLGKGIKKITSRRISHIQTGNLIEAIIYFKNNRYYLQETSLISAFSKIKKDQKKIKAIYLFFFILEHLLPDNQRENKVYNLTKKILIDLSGRTFEQDDLNEYINRLLTILGYLHEDKQINDLISFIEELINQKIPVSMML